MGKTKQKLKAIPLEFVLLNNKPEAIIAPKETHN